MLADNPLLGFLTLYLYASHGSPERVVVVLSSALLIIVPGDIIRLNYPSFERNYEKVLGFLMRESEKVCHLLHLFGCNCCLTPSPLSDFVETYERRDMVHHRRDFRTLAIPRRYRHNIHHDVSHHPPNRPTPP